MGEVLPDGTIQGWTCGCGAQVGMYGHDCEWQRQQAEIRRLRSALKECYDWFDSPSDPSPYETVAVALGLMVPCPDHDATEGPHHSTECCRYADEYE